MILYYRYRAMYVGSAVCNPKSIIRVCKKCPFSTYDCKSFVVIEL